MDKQKVVYTYNGILFCLKKKCILTRATTRMNFRNIMLSEISLAEKEIVDDSTYMRYLE